MLIFASLNGMSLSFENQVVNTNLDEKRQHPIVEEAPSSADESFISTIVLPQLP